MMEQQLGFLKNKMPYAIKKGSGSRPWKIIKKTTGKTVGSSTSRQMAVKAVKARIINEHKNG